jgi:hypothetical protein
MIVDLFVFGNAYCAWTKRETVYVCEPRKYNKSCNCCKRVFSSRAGNDCSTSSHDDSLETALGVSGHEEQNRTNSLFFPK